MASTPTYPNDDIARMAADGAAEKSALVSAVIPDTPAYDAGFEAGCRVTSVDGEPVRDVIDWRWLADGECITVGYVDLDGETGEVELWREPGQEWGFEFEGLVFDGVKQCRNACTFCFMRQMPDDMRPSLTLRDDDFRLSFLVGTFVTLTNLTAEDEARIIEQRISPLRMSLQASNPLVRARLIGKHAQHGLDALERLLAAGIEFHAQIVLVPGENDGDALAETLAWAYERPGILEIGIVPLGYTRHQTAFDRSFNNAHDAQALLDLIKPFQTRALAERGTPWVYAADEFYRNAHREDLLDHLPSTSFYGDFAMFEDGIGIIRSTVDDWHNAERAGAIARAATALREKGAIARLIAGYAQKEFLDPLIAEAGIGDCFAALYVKNTFFGGNVDVTGLLVGEDIVTAVQAAVAPSELSEAARKWRRSGSEDCLRQLNSGASCEEGAKRGQAKGAERPWLEATTRRAKPPLHGSVFLIPRVIFNDDGVTLDDMTLEDMEKAAGQTLHMVSCTPASYFEEINAIIA